MSNRKRMFLVLFTTVALLGCEGTNLFDAPSAAIDVAFRADTPVVIDYRVSGGIAGISRRLTVYDNQLVRFIDHEIFPQHSYRDLLDKSEYEVLISTFVTNNFYGLRDEYLDPEVADAFYYNITFNHGGFSKTVLAQDGATNEQLDNIIIALNSTMESLRMNGAQLRLALSDSSVAAGDTVTFTLTVTTPPDEDLTLIFPSSQIYDYFVLRDPLVPGEPVPEDKALWRWSADKQFSQVVWKMELPANEVETYSEAWVARDSNGDPLQGRFWVVASLKSVPGGDTQAIELNVE